MENRSYSDKMSKTELFLFILLLICYACSLYFLIVDNRSFLILFFILHSCLSIIFFLTFHDRISNFSLQKDHSISAQLDEELNMLSKYSDEISSLKKERDALLAERETLASKCSDIEQQLSSVSDSLEQERQKNEQTTSTANLSDLLPQSENPVDLNIIDCANHVIAEMEPYSRKSGIQIQLSTASDTLMVRADTSFMRILFRNIIDNSIKYMNRNGSLVITISNIGTDLFIVLKDNGEGLSVSETTRIFELNYQGSNRVSGNGLGLTQSKAIVEYYGGTIYAKSEPGKGMAIYIQLPANYR